MKHKREPSQTKSAITTTLMELLETLSCLTRDDRLVIAMVKDIFDTHRVRLLPSLAPLRLVRADLPIGTKAHLRISRPSSWA